jgi:signal transduction histidine kinase
LALSPRVSYRAKRSRRSSPEAMRRLRYALWATGLAFGVAAEWIGRPDFIVLDSCAGFALLLLGLTAWSRRPASGVGPIMAAAGFAWFLGTLWTPAVFLNRGSLAHLLLSYPSGKLVPSTRLDRAAVVTAYAYASVYPVASNDYATMVFALGLVLVSARRFGVAGGIERRARLAALLASAAFSAVLALGAAIRIAGLNSRHEVLLAIRVVVLPTSAVLIAYDVVVLLIAVGLSIDLLWGRWARAAATGLVIDLGAPTHGTLRDTLARALGDPTLELAFFLPERQSYVNESGEPSTPPAPSAGRILTPIEYEGSRLAVLAHDQAALDDPELLAAAVSATGLAITNARLQAQVRARVAEVEASRRRIVEAADDQRRTLELRLRQGAQRHLVRVAELVGEVEPELGTRVEAARVEVREFARGVYPETLTKHGLAAAVRELGERSPVPVVVVGSLGRLPASVETAGYFFCSEALANVVKHSQASRVTIRLERSGGRAVLRIEDDGIGGAHARERGGLRGLADRVEALGGRLTVESPPGVGTRVSAELPRK